MSSAELNEVTPSPAHLALALVTVRSKPADIPLDDYLTMLSNSIVQKPTVSAQHAQFETALFWKQAYQRAEAEKNQLQEYVHRVEQARLETAGVDMASLSKRRADIDEPVKANTQYRRREANRNSLSVSQNDNMRTLLRHVFHLKCLLRSDNPCVKQLCLCIGALCQSHEGLLDSLSSTRDNGTANCHGLDPAGILSAFHASYPSILEAIDQATSREAPDNVITIANASVVQLFQATLRQLHRLSLDEVTRQEEAAQSRVGGGSKKPRSNTKVAAKNFQQIKVTLEEHSAVFVRMLDSMLTSINPTKDSHCELLEGLLCALLDHVGSSLSLVVFADPTAAKGQTGIEAPRGLDDVSHIATKAALTAANVEAPYLVVVLRKALRFVRSIQGQMSPWMQEVFSWRDPKDLPGGAKSASVLRERIEARLQGALLRGVFGDDDATFEDALRREFPLENKDLDMIKADLQQQQQQQQQQGMSTWWFVGQVWEELGWQVLSQPAKQRHRA